MHTQYPHTNPGMTPHLSRYTGAYARGAAEIYQKCMELAESNKRDVNTTAETNEERNNI